MKHSEQHDCGAMTCQQFIDLILDFLEQDLTPDVQRLCRDHLESCRSCVDYLSSYQATTELGRRVYKFEDEREVSLPEDVVRAILGAAG